MTSGISTMMNVLYPIYKEVNGKIICVELSSMVQCLYKIQSVERSIAIHIYIQNKCLLEN